MNTAAWTPCSPARSRRRSTRAASIRCPISYSTRQLEVLLINHRERSFPLDSLKVRQAIRYAINVDSISQNVYMGMTTDADTPIPSDSWLYYDQENTFVYNPDKARELLAEDGWVDLDGNGILDKPVEGAEEPSIWCWACGCTRTRTTTCVLKRLT